MFSNPSGLWYSGLLQKYRIYQEIPEEIIKFLGFRSFGITGRLEFTALPRFFGKI